MCLRRIPIDKLSIRIRIESSDGVIKTTDVFHGSFDRRFYPSERFNDMLRSLYYEPFIDVAIIVGSSFKTVLRFT